MKDLSKHKYKLMSAKKGFRLLVLFASFFILFSALAMTVINTYEQTQQKDAQLQSLKADVDAERLKNQQLTAENEYSQSLNYLEKEAKKSGFVYPGEQIYIIKWPSPTVTQMPITQNQISAKSSDNGKSNIEKWLDLLFG